MTDQALDGNPGSPAGRPAGAAAARLFDAKASGWPAKYAPGGRLEGRLAGMTRAVRGRVPAGGSVLDLGCGAGNLAFALAGTGMRVAGCDISPRMLGQAAQASRAACFIRLDPGWQTLPLRPASFDAVVATSVLEYVADPEAVLRECRRVLRPGGTVLATVPDPSHPVRWLEWLAAIAARMPGVAAAGRRWPRLGSYLAYLRVSRHRHGARWWRETALRAGLDSGKDTGRRAPLRMVMFTRPPEVPPRASRPGNLGGDRGR